MILHGARRRKGTHPGTGSLLHYLIILGFCPPTTLQQFIRKAVDLHDRALDLWFVEEGAVPAYGVRHYLTHVLVGRRRGIVHQMDRFGKFGRVPEIHMSDRGH